MVAEVHVDRDPIELADAGHVAHRRAQSGRGGQAADVASALTCLELCALGMGDVVRTPASPIRLGRRCSYTVEAVATRGLSFYGGKPGRQGRRRPGMPPGRYCSPSLTENSVTVVSSVASLPAAGDCRTTTQLRSHSNDLMHRNLRQCRSVSAKGNCADGRVVQQPARQAGSRARGHRVALRAEVHVRTLCARRRRALTLRARPETPPGAKGAIRKRQDADWSAGLVRPSPQAPSRRVPDTKKPCDVQGF